MMPSSIIHLSFYQLLIFLFFLSSSPFAFGGLGKNIPLNQLTNQLCLIRIEMKGPIYAEICSGFLLDSNTIVTAGHCTQKVTSMSAVQCGEKTSPIQSFQRHPNLNLLQLDKAPSFRKFDLAILKLTKSIPAKNIFISSTNSSLIQILQNTKECAFFGFSQILGSRVSEEKISAKGTFVNPTALKIKNGILILDGTLANVAFVEPGDSGGALACKHYNSWTFLGVVSGHDWEYNSFFTPLMNHPQMSTYDNVEKIPHEKMPRITDEKILKIQANNIYKVKQYSTFIKTKNSEVLGFNANDTKRLNDWAYEHSTIDHTVVKFETIKKVSQNQWLGNIQFNSHSTAFTCTDGFICSSGMMSYVLISESDLK